MISHQRPWCGVFGVPSYMTHVAPLASGPYTMYEWPVTQPTSAVHQKTSSSFRSKTYLWVDAVPTRYPPVVCSMPFGLPVVPEVYRMYSGCSESRRSGSTICPPDSFIASCHHTSRPARIDTFDGSSVRFT